jgi:hypothetical protein
MLLDAHVTHLHFLDEFIDRHSLGALKGIKDFETLGASNFGKQSLIHKDRPEFDSPTLHAAIFKKQYQKLRKLRRQRKLQRLPPEGQTAGFSAALSRERKIDNYHCHVWRCGIVRIDCFQPCARRIKAALHKSKGNLLAQFFAHGCARNPANALFLL